MVLVIDFAGLPYDALIRHLAAKFTVFLPSKHDSKNMIQMQLKRWLETFRVIRQLNVGVNSQVYNHSQYKTTLWLLINVAIIVTCLWY